MNPNLLQISSTPIRIELNITRAALVSPGTKQPRGNVKTEFGGHRMSSRPARINHDSYAARASVGYGGMKTADVIRDDAQRSIRLAERGTIRIVEEGNQLARGASPVDIAIQNERAGQTIETMVTFIPSERVELTFEPGELNVELIPNDVNITWEHLDATRLIFNPGRIEFSVNQYPKVVIEYVGDPIYFPASANPNYEARA